MIKDFVWKVPGKIKYVIDADTFHAEIDLGWNRRLENVRIRFSNIDAPPLGTPEGDAGKDYLARILPEGRIVVIESEELDQYGRVLGLVKLLNGHDVGKKLVRAGHATLR